MTRWTGRRRTEVIALTDDLDDGEVHQEIVYIPVNKRRGSKEVYHTDPDCGYLDNAKNVGERRRDVLHEDIRKCNRCAGNTNDGGAGRGHQESLKQAARGDGNEEIVTDGGHPVVRPGQTWACNEKHASPNTTPPAHKSVRLWPDYTRFHGIVDAVVCDVAALVVGTSNSHPRAPALGDRVDIHVDTLHEENRWSLHKPVADGPGVSES